MSMGRMVGEVHVTPQPGKPCLACTFLTQALADYANQLWCDPAKSNGCGHHHKFGPCPEVRDA